MQDRSGGTPLKLCHLTTREGEAGQAKDRKARG